MVTTKSLSDDRRLPTPIESILDYWFDGAPAGESEMNALYARWFKGSAKQDEEITSLFSKDHSAAARGELDDWAESPRGRLALIVLLDQFSRNIYRGTPAAFQHDDKALTLTLTGIDLCLDTELAPLPKGFFYMPMQHAESMEIQARSVKTFEALAESDVAPLVKRTLDGFAEYARLHRDIIARFGRFPHRNAILGRDDTEEERRFLIEGGPTFGQ